MPLRRTAFPIFSFLHSQELPKQYSMLLRMLLYNIDPIRKREHLLKGYYVLLLGGDHGLNPERLQGPLIPAGIDWDKGRPSVERSRNNWSSCQCCEQPVPAEIFPHFQGSAAATAHTKAGGAAAGLQLPCHSPAGCKLGPLGLGTSPGCVTGYSAQPD